MKLEHLAEAAELAEQLEELQTVRHEIIMTETIKIASGDTVVKFVKKSSLNSAIVDWIESKIGDISDHLFCLGVKLPAELEAQSKRDHPAPTAGEVGVE